MNHVIQESTQDVLIYPYHPWDERYIYPHEWLICMANVGKYTWDGLGRIIHFSDFNSIFAPIKRPWILFFCSLFYYDTIPRQEAEVFFLETDLELGKLLQAGSPENHGNL